jgi:glyoxylase-like metal-dependent hydrolase (beta-lactamase superfamily II)
MNSDSFFLTYTGGIAETNGYFLPTPEGSILIDAPEGVAEWLTAKGLRVTRLLLTHQHFDHVMDVPLAAGLMSRSRFFRQPSGS